MTLVGEVFKGGCNRDQGGELEVRDAGRLHKSYLMEQKPCPMQLTLHPLRRVVSLNTVAPAAAGFASARPQSGDPA